MMRRDRRGRKGLCVFWSLFCDFLLALKDQRTKGRRKDRRRPIREVGQRSLLSFLVDFVAFSTQ